MVSNGDTYRKGIADTNCLIRIDKIDGPIAIGTVVDEPATLNGITLPSDYAGQQVSDLLENVERRVAGAKAWDQTVQRLNEANYGFWETLQGGEALHYRNFPAEFYRGVAERQDDGTMAMKITALVGRWSDNERPRRNAYGEVQEGYAARQVREGGTLRPNASFMFESTQYTNDRLVDPTVMEAIDLSLPPLTSEEAEQIDLERFLREVREASEGDDSPAERLARVKELLAK